jgi:hypothetical protein
MAITLTGLISLRRDQALCFWATLSALANDPDQAFYRRERREKLRPGSIHFDGNVRGVRSMIFSPTSRKIKTELGIIRA